MDQRFCDKMNPQNKTDTSENSMRMQMQPPSKEVRPVKYEDRCK